MRTVIYLDVLLLVNFVVGAAFLLAAVSAAIAIPVGMLALPDIATILLQAAVMAAAYLGLSKLFKVEALGYLLATAKEVVILKRG